MTRKVFVPALALTAALYFGCAAAPPAAPAPDPAAMVAAADQLDQSFLAAWNARDAAGMASHYWDSANVVGFPPDAMVIRGHQAMLDYWTKGLAETPEGSTFEISEHRNTPAGDVVLGSGLFRYTVPMPDGPMVIEGRYTDVKAERDGKWVYLMDHASAPMAPPVDN